MAEVKVFYDREGRTLTVWFTDRTREYVCEETGDEVVLMKDASGRVLGFEKPIRAPGGRTTPPAWPARSAGGEGSGAEPGRRRAQGENVQGRCAASRAQGATTGQNASCLCARMAFEDVVPRTYDRITHLPDVLAGRATIRGLRVSVAHVVNLVANGMTPAEVVQELPDLDEEDVRQALAYAAALAQDELHPLRA